MAKKRVRKRIKFTCSRCSEKFIATGCTSGMCKACRKLPPGEAPHCACGCGEKTAWKGAIKTGSWNKYIQGHHLKDKDWNGKNPGFEKGHLTWNKGNREYSGVCAREGCDVYFESSWDRKYCSRDCANIAAKGREPWHKGLNKHMDDRVAALGRSVAASRLIEPVHNKGKTKDDYEPLKRAGENISIVLKDAYAEGRLIPWAKGLDKTDERVA